MRGVAGVIAGLGAGISATAILTLGLLASTGQIRPIFAGVYTTLTIAGLLLAALGWLLTHE